MMKQVFDLSFLEIELCITSLILAFALWWQNRKLIKLSNRSNNSKVTGGCGIATQMDVRGRKPYLDKPIADDEQGWLMALSAIDCEREGFYHDRLNLLPLKREDCDVFFDRFVRRHSLRNFAAWQQKMSWLESVGYRTELETLKGFIELITMNQSIFGSPPESDVKMRKWLNEFCTSYGEGKDSIRQRQLLLLNDRKLFFSDLNGLAYDCSRYGLYCRAGVRLKYIDEKEAWQRLSEIAETVKQDYVSWEHYLKHCKLMTEFIEGDFAERQVVSVGNLIMSVGMPWNVVKWRGLEKDSNIVEAESNSTFVKQNLPNKFLH